MRLNINETGRETSTWIILRWQNLSHVTRRGRQTIRIRACDQQVWTALS